MKEGLCFIFLRYAYTRGTPLNAKTVTPMKKTTILAILAILTAACVPEPDNGKTTPPSKDEVLLSSSSVITLDAAGGTGTITFTASGQWSVAPSNDRPTWLEIDPATGSAGKVSVKVTAHPNDTPDERSAALRITCGSASTSVSVTQKQKDALTQTPSKTQFGAEGGTFTIVVRANIAYSLDIDSDWIHGMSTKALTESSSSFTVDRNEDTRKREGHITVKSSLGSEAVTIYQEAAEPSLILSRDAVALGSDGGTFTVDVNANVDFEMRISAGSSWLGEVATRAMSTHSFTFEASPNEGYDNREGRITFRNTANGIEASVSVTQMQRDALVISQSVHEIGADGGSVTIEAATNVGVGVDISEPWVHRVETKALQDVAFGFSVDPNPLYDARECVVTFRGEDSPVRQEVTIRQDGADGFISDFKEKYYLGASQQTLELKSRSSVELEAVSDSDWITVVQTKVLSERSVTLQISGNTAEGSRSGKVTVSAPSLGLDEVVTILQAGSGDAYIPDDAFRTLLLSEFDTDGDGILSKKECGEVEYISLNAITAPSVSSIRSFEGIEHFVKLYSIEFRATTPDGKRGSLEGKVDLRANTRLRNLTLEGCGLVEGVDVGGCKNILSLSMDGARSLRELTLPSEDGLYLSQIYITGSHIGPELDLGNFPDLQYIYLKDNQDLGKVWLVTGLKPAQLVLDDGCTVAYKGDNPNREAVFKDPVLREMMLNSAYFKSYDWNGDGTFSYRELERIESFSIWPENFGGMDEGKAITSFEDLSMLPNLRTFAMSDLYGRVTAPLPQCLGDLTEIDRILIDDCDIVGPIPESICRMGKLRYLNLVNLRLSGQLPSGIGSIDSLTDLVITGCPDIGGPIPESLVVGCKYDYINLGGCNFDDTYISVPSPMLLEHTAQERNFSYLGGTTREYLLPGGNTYYEYPSIYFRSTADGNGAVHADGEVELYHAATKGPGLDIFITGDGFTAENNTVGGTLETYMKHLADVTLAMEPYDKLREYFNIYLIYAHSQREGTGFASTEGLRFASFQPSPGTSSRCNGDHDAICAFVQEATGRHESSGTVALVMNSSHYGGTCYYYYAPIYDAGIAIGYTPAAWMMDLTYVHETLGHGFAHLDDEYDASSQSASYTYSGNYYSSAGFGSNMDATESVRWSPFITDPRYEGEGIGAYATRKRISTYFGSGYTDYYRPTVNSVMNSQWEEGGNRFNAPSREAIWQRVQILANPGDNWESWEDYVQNGYDREEFVSFDLAPSLAPSSAPKVMRSPERTLPDGRKVGQVPPHTPPVILGLPESE